MNEAVDNAIIELMQCADYIEQSGDLLGARKIRNTAEDLAEMFDREITKHDQ